VSKVKVDTIRPRVGTQIALIGGLSANDEIIAPSVIGTTLSAGSFIYGDGTNMSNTGKVLQVVSYSFTGVETFSTTSTYQDTSVTANITPASTSSKILVAYSVMCGAMSVEGPLRLKRVIGSGSATYPILADAAGNVGGPGRASTYAAYYGAHTYMADIQSLSYLDEPATVSNIVYTVQTTTYSSSYPTFINKVGSNATWTHTSDSTSSITVMEIAG
jgi:hypothetical protein